ncbi:MAG: DNA-binding MarR family transcriptional regulator [Parasphingorhabdus sp.]
MASKSRYTFQWAKAKMDQHKNQLSSRDLRQFLTFKFSRAQAKLNAQASHVLKGNCELSLVQWRILALLASSGPTSASQCSQLGAIDKGQFSRKVKSLIKDGLVKSTVSKTDARQQQLSASAKGNRLYHRILPIMQAQQTYLLSKLTAGEQDMLLTVLDKLDQAAEHKDFSV